MACEQRWSDCNIPPVCVRIRRCRASTWCLIRLGSRHSLPPISSLPRTLAKAGLSQSLTFSSMALNAWALLHRAPWSSRIPFTGCKLRGRRACMSLALRADHTAIRITRTILLLRALEKRSRICATSYRPSLNSPRQNDVVGGCKRAKYLQKPTRHTHGTTDFGQPLQSSNQ